MSTVKTKRVQIGSDADPTKNFTLYQPDVPDGTLHVARGNAGSTDDVVIIQADGSLNLPQQPRFSARLTSEGVGADFSAGTRVPFNSVPFDIGDGYDDATHAYIAPSAGHYFFEAQVMEEPYYGDWSTGTLQIRVNGSMFFRSTDYGDTARAVIHVAGGVELQAGDEVDLLLTVTSTDTDLRFEANGSWFFGMKIG